MSRTYHARAPRKAPSARSARKRESRSERTARVSRTYRANLAIRRALLDRMWIASDDSERSALQRALRVAESLA